MKNHMPRNNFFRRKAVRYTAVFSVLLSTVFFYGFVQEDDLLYKVGKGLDLFTSVYKEISFNYVDDLDPIALMEAGIDGMLSSLDPYTTYIDEQDKSDVDILTTGQYGGIGISVHRAHNRLIVSDINEDVRGKTNLRIGDELVTIDGIELTTNPDIDLKTLLRGKPGTTVNLVVNRPGVGNRIPIPMKRNKIVLDNISFVTVLNDSIGYIKLDRFSRNAGNDLRLALKNLEERAEIKAMILDLRNNPGGLLDAAVDVSEKFLPEGSLIVSTKGRKKNYDRYFYCSESPVLRDEPLIILVNEGSASASEIVAGAIQDNDRGLIVGTRTFGKGLVQNVIPLSYNSSIKITTSKYYTPSGRCIQKIDYSQKHAASIFKQQRNDTAKTFTTLHLQRGVKEAGGINPDYVVSTAPKNKFLQHLLKDNVVFDFVTLAVNTGKITTSAISAENLKALFRTYVDTTTVDSTYEVKKQYDDLVSLAQEYGYRHAQIEALESMRGIFARKPLTGVEDHWDDIEIMIRRELALRMSGDSQNPATAQPPDIQLHAALELLRSHETYLAAFTLHEN